MANAALDRARFRAAAARAFSLVEMLTVLVILVLVLSILLPVLGRVRNTAKDAASRNIMKDIGNASSQFTLDQKRTPGYFSPLAMGDKENTATYGFTGMSNLLLDITGGIVQTTSETLGDSNPCSAPAAGGPSIIQVGPTMKQQVYVDIAAMGNPTQDRKGVVARAYFKPDPKYFVAQCQAFQSTPTTMTDKALPMVVDGFGMPILAWVQDDLTTSDTAFAADESGPNKRAKFYWASNAGVLRATAAGKVGEDQKNNSLLGDGLPGTVSIDGKSYGYKEASLMGLLGNPGGGATPATGTGPFAPTLARGPIVLHSAGIDGKFLGKTERGGKVAGGTYLPFRPNQDSMGTGAFDDTISAFGN